MHNQNIPQNTVENIAYDADRISMHLEFDQNRMCYAAYDCCFSGDFFRKQSILRCTLHRSNPENSQNYAIPFLSIVIF